MKVILYMAISIDGFIAKENDDISWVSDTDWGVFSQLIKDVGCIVMGRKTYEVSGEDFPYKGALNIVMTGNNNLKSKDDKVLFTNRSPKEIINLAEERGFNQLMIIGGGKTNGSFLKENLIDEIFLSVHPLVLSQGIKLFEKCDIGVKLKLLGIKQLKQDLVQLHYLVKK